MHHFALYNHEGVFIEILTMSTVLDMFDVLLEKGHTTKEQEGDLQLVSVGFTGQYRVIYQSGVRFLVTRIPKKVWF